MRGTIGAALRTGLVGGGFVVLLGGIVTLAYPPLLTETIAGGGQTGIPTKGSPGFDMGTMITSAKLILAGLSVVAAGLAVPGRSRRYLIVEQPFTRRQRLYTLFGAVFVVGFLVKNTTALLTNLLGFPRGILLFLLGGIMLLIGTATGLQPRRR